MKGMALDGFNPFSLENDFGVCQLKDLGYLRGEK
jgi:hypothetical protein